MAERPLRRTGVRGISPLEPSLWEPDYFRSFNAVGLADGTLVIAGEGSDPPPGLPDAGPPGMPDLRRGLAYIAPLMFLVEEAGDYGPERCLVDLLAHRVVVEVPLTEDINVAATFAVANDALGCVGLDFLPASGRRQSQPRRPGLVSDTDDHGWPERHGWIVPGKRNGQEPAVPPISARLLRTLELGRLQRRADEWLAELTGVAHKMETSSELPDDIRRGAQHMTAGLSVIGRPGRRGRQDVDYLPLVRLYLEMCAKSDRPLEEMKSMLEDTAHPLRVPQIRDRISEARRRGLLPKVGRGRQGGQLTEYALRLIAEQEAPTDGLNP